MAPNTTRNAGRQLLITRNRLRTEENPSRIATLKRREAGILLELEQKEAAVAVAASLVKENPQGNRERAFYADILARTFQWASAEEEFSEAHRLCIASGKLEKANSLAAGPLFLLAEARGDFKRCSEVAPIEALRFRALRLAGETTDIPSVPLESPWREIALLEKVLRGGNPHVLPSLLANWTCGEAEWRWRILYEGATAAMEADMPVKPWKKYLKQAGNSVLDPRYFIERRDLKRLLSRGLVHY